MEDEKMLLSVIEKRILEEKKEEPARKKIFIKEIFKAEKPEDLNKFHIKCDHKGPTITVLYGTDVCFGGYTRKSWYSGTKESKSTDSQAFLFCKNTTDECKFFQIKLKRKDRTITCDSRFGPTFGGKRSNDYDLQAFDLSAKSKSEMKNGYMQLNGKMNFGLAYKCDGPKVKRSEINGGTMNVKLMKVYQVVDATDKDMWREQPTEELVEHWKAELHNLQPKNFGIEFYNILFIGVVSAGKSSFFNTLASEFAESVIAPAQAAEEGTSVTNKLHMHKLNKSINIIDIRGFGADRTFRYELEHLLNGYLPDGYQFPEKDDPVRMDEILKYPKLSEEIHLVCFVVDGEKVEAQQQDDSLMRSFNSVKQGVRRKGIPIAAVATKFDLICPNINENTESLYDSPKAHTAVGKVAKMLGLKEKEVFPIVNYVNDSTLSPCKSGLAFQALHYMIQRAEVYVNNRAQRTASTSLKVIWREKPQDDDISKMKQELLSWKPSIGFGVHFFNILLVGEIGAGKSSFYNTLASTFAEKCISPAPTANDVTNVTNKVHVYTLKNSRGRNLCVNIIDIRGFDDKRNYEYELEHLLNGKLPAKYEFPDTAQPLKSEQLVECPTLRGEVHLVCFVVDVLKLQEYDENGKIRQSFGDIRRIIQAKGLPVTAVATKLDQLDPNINQDPVNIYESPRACEAVKQVAKMLGLQDKDVFPIVNSDGCGRLTPGISLLAIQALHSIVRSADIHLQIVEQEKDRQLKLQVQAEIEELSEKNIRVLCVGAVNSGKSSFIDSIMSSLTGHICSHASGSSFSEETNDDSFTEKFHLYPLNYKNAEGAQITTNIQIGDMPGFQETNGVELEHVKLVIEGHVEDDAEIKHGIDKNQKWYIKEPRKNDRFHCVCIMLKITSINLLSTKIRKMYQDLIEWLTRKGFAFVLILTNCDCLSQTSSENTVDTDIRTRKTKVMEYKDKVIESMRVKANKVFLVQNYIHENVVNPEKDKFLLDAFREIVKLGKNNMDNTFDPDDEQAKASVDTKF